MSREEKLEDIRNWLKDNEDVVSILVGLSYDLEKIKDFDLPHKELFFEEINKKCTKEDVKYREEIENAIKEVFYKKGMTDNEYKKTLIANFVLVDSDYHFCKMSDIAEGETTLEKGLDKLKEQLVKGCF